MEAQTRLTLARPVEALLDPYPRLGIGFGDASIYQRFRAVEPQLVSCIDDSESDSIRPEILVVELDGAPAGVLSFVVQANTQRKSFDNLFARVDLVIVPGKHRKLGMARLLVLTALLQLLEELGTQLYSISCLAAHPAIESILEDVGFGGEIREGYDFKHEELKLEGVNIAKLRQTLLTKATAAAQLTNYRLRQHRNEP